MPEAVGEDIWVLGRVFLRDPITISKEFLLRQNPLSSPLPDSIAFLFLGPVLRVIYRLIHHLVVGNHQVNSRDFRYLEFIWISGFKMV